jgi:NADH dehydrogenase FAD-containing subunit
VNDYRKLHKKMEELNNAAENNKNIVILGGGLLGAELAYSLNRRYARDNEGSKLRIIQVAQEHGIARNQLNISLK